MSAIVGGEILCCALIFATVFFAVTGPASRDGLTPALRNAIMSIQTAADAMTSAASGISTAADALTSAATALAGANDTTALDGPVANLNDAVGRLTTAVSAIQALVPAPAQ